MKTLVLVLLVSSLSVATDKAQRSQPGATQGGPTTGTETIRHIENGRYFDVSVELEGPDDGLSGKGIIFFESGPFGSHLTKYVVYDAGFTLLQPGPVGGDLGGYYIASSGRHPSRFTTTTRSF